eukprot:365084-Chlamydomonas_euryale.AAC.11
MNRGGQSRDKQGAVEVVKNGQSEDGQAAVKVVKPGQSEGGQREREVKVTKNGQSEDGQVPEQCPQGGTSDTRHTPHHLASQKIHMDQPMEYRRGDVWPTLLHHPSTAAVCSALRVCRLPSRCLHCARPYRPAPPFPPSRISTPAVCSASHRRLPRSRSPTPAHAAGVCGVWLSGEVECGRLVGCGSLLRTAPTPGLDVCVVRGGGRIASDRGVWGMAGAARGRERGCRLVCGGDGDMTVQNASNPVFPLQAPICGRRRPAVQGGEGEGTWAERKARGKGLTEGGMHVVAGNHMLQSFRVLP